MKGLMMAEPGPRKRTLADPQECQPSTTKRLQLALAPLQVHSNHYFNTYQIMVKRIKPNNGMVIKRVKKKKKKPFSGQLLGSLINIGKKKMPPSSDNVKWNPQNLKVVDVNERLQEFEIKQDHTMSSSLPVIQRPRNESVVVH